MSGDEGWKDYRLLVLEMLERHEDVITKCKEERYSDREDSRERLLRHCKEMKAEILAELKPSAEVQAAKITGTWQFWASMATSAGAVIVAVIALLK